MSNRPLTTATSERLHGEMVTDIRRRHVEEITGGDVPAVAWVVVGEAEWMDHPCKGMTKAQIDTFEQLAVGGKPPATIETWRKLEARGVIERGPDLVRRDAFGELKIPQWHVPIHIHAQWCEWCSENVAAKEAPNE